MDKFPIHHWRHETGDTDDNMRDIPAGWYCWAYATRTEFDLPAWMKENMLGPYDCDLRFNSGDPMYTVYIKNEKDAMTFSLKWL